MKRALIAIALLASCKTATAPDESGALKLETIVSRTSAAVGDSITITHRLTNRGSATVELTFGGGCHILPYVVVGSDAVVYPEGGWACTAAVTELTLQPGESRTNIHRFGSQGAGAFETYATVDAVGVALRSKPVSFRIQ